MYKNSSFHIYECDVKLAYLTTFDLDKVYDHKLCYTS
jgi:hypothetical protein